MVHTVITRVNPGLIMNLLNKQIFVSFGKLGTQFRNILIATAILLMVVVGIAAFPSQSSEPSITVNVNDPQGANCRPWVEGTNFTPGATINAPGDASSVSYGGTITGLKGDNWITANGGNYNHIGDPITVNDDGTFGFSFTLPMNSASVPGYRGDPPSNLGESFNFSNSGPLIITDSSGVSATTNIPIRTINFTMSSQSGGPGSEVRVDYSGVYCYSGSWSGWRSTLTDFSYDTIADGDGQTGTVTPLELEYCNGWNTNTKTCSSSWIYMEDHINYPSGGGVNGQRVNIPDNAAPGQNFIRVVYSYYDYNESGWVKVWFGAPHKYADIPTPTPTPMPDPTTVLEVNPINNTGFWYHKQAGPPEHLTNPIPCTGGGNCQFYFYNSYSGSGGTYYLLDSNKSIISGRTSPSRHYVNSQLGTYPSWDELWNNAMASPSPQSNYALLYDDDPAGQYYLGWQQEDGDPVYIVSSLTWPAVGQPIPSNHSSLTQYSPLVNPPGTQPMTGASNNTINSNSIVPSSLLFNTPTPGPIPVTTSYSTPDWFSLTQFNYITTNGYWYNNQHGPPESYLNPINCNHYIHCRYYFTTTLPGEKIVLMDPGGCIVQDRHMPFNEWHASNEHWDWYETPYNFGSSLFKRSDPPGQYYLGMQQEDGEIYIVTTINMPPPGLTSSSAATTFETCSPTAPPADLTQNSGLSFSEFTSNYNLSGTNGLIAFSGLASLQPTPTPVPEYLRSAGATPFPSIPKYGTPIPTPSISTSQPYIMIKNPRGRYITTSEPVGTEVNIIGANFPGGSEIESMWLTPVDPPHGEPLDITPQTKYFDIWSLSYKYQKNQTDKSGVVDETIIVPDAPPGLYYIELTARQVLGTTTKTQSALFRIPGEPDVSTPVPYAIPAPYPTSTPYPIPVQVRAQRNISFDTQTRNSMKYDIDFGPNKICSDDL